MSVPRLTGTRFAGPETGDLLLVGPSLGTSATALWAAAAERLSEHVRVVGWDLPGHGRSQPTASPFTIAELGAAVLALADEIAPGAAFHYAGDSIGGAVGLQLMLDAPVRVLTATLLCTAAVFGDHSVWRDRAALVRQSGTVAVIDIAQQRWFAAGLTDLHPVTASALLDTLRSADNESYAIACEALASFDVSNRLAEITNPVLAIAGEQDIATPVQSLRHIVSEVQNGRLVELDGVAHLAPAEAPVKVAHLIVGHVRPPTPFGTAMAVRRDVLGDDHVDRAVAATTPFTADFQDLITRYAWGSIWTRPGLDRRTRSLITLTALVARGRHEELAMHLRAARRNGLTNGEIKELLLQTAVYCGVPEANSAFHIANTVLADYDAEQERL
ncbi:bifunctional 3-oxoadipate enol-lactonase/4-carboxymuconolactone decarboxylase PcaDC [Mycobacterium intracellulare]|uniref:4-carboxymuconolactone decarboxylase n=1 Tax=Mycobacterium intracellulare TaxID=1767 RepID=A0AAE4RGJ5_MYCIT|nr:4-carboxymuconolactone decarboxylase [Mycobacterium intracellulare]MDV6979096.1 4-carboxymuconolactone decarboxylase [Mycobacterium intracellulare]MDV6984504.1 4-carboxymuconolactone decarboxylase [Mycobacterium intracellulare]MDV7014598.1 4-carboxymuconolactone decarboxylase [Mycobacterium intracellulare]MDV7029514.1 4-carboxymuconolactone decarboxylase [Mycobacterium intracellulare]